MKSESASPLPDLSSRVLPIIFSIVLGVVYILASTVLLVRHERVQFFLWGFFPVLQFLYIGPLAYRCRQKDQHKAFQGWLIGAALAVLLTSPCWGIAWASKLGKL